MSDSGEASPDTGAAGILLSLDIDGTLVTGNPPGPVTIEFVVRAKELGLVVGSASDRPVSHQQSMWARVGIEVDFVGHKHHLGELILPFGCMRHLHIGDTDTDRHYAHLAGMDFMHVDEVPEPASPLWIL